MPDFEIKGDPAGIRSRARTMTTKADLFSDTGSALRDLDTKKGWYGRSAERFGEKNDQEPTRWWEAGGAFRSGGAAINAYADALEHAQNEASRAKEEYERGEDATREAKTAYAEYEGRYNKLKSQAISDGLEYPWAKEPFSDPGDELRKNALEIFAAAKRGREDAARVCAADVRSACRNAPEKRNWLENRIHANLEILKGAGEAVWELVEMGFSKYNPQWQMTRAMLRGIGLMDESDLTTEELKMQFQLDGEMLEQAWDAAKADPLEFGKQLGKGMLDWDTWADNPARAVGHLLPDIVAAILTGGTAGAASRGLRIGASIADTIGDIGGSAKGLTRAADAVEGIGDTLNVGKKLFGSAPISPMPDVDMPGNGAPSHGPPDGSPVPDAPADRIDSPDQGAPSSNSTAEAPEQPTTPSPEPFSHATQSPEPADPRSLPAQQADLSPASHGQASTADSAVDSPGRGSAPDAPVPESNGRGGAPHSGPDHIGSGSATEATSSPVGRGSVPPPPDPNVSSPNGVAPEPTRAPSADPTPTPMRTKPRDLSNYELPNQTAHHPESSPVQSGGSSGMADLESRMGGHVEPSASASPTTHHSPETPGPDASNAGDGHAGPQQDSPDGSVDGSAPDSTDVSAHEPDTGHDATAEHPEKRSRDDYPGLDRYTADGYEEMNARLRGLTEELNLSTDPAQIAELDRLIDLTSRELKEFPEHAGTTYRVTRLPDDVLARITDGGTFKDDAFLSTSKNAATADTLHGAIGQGTEAKVRFEVDGHSGRDLTSVFAKESEVLFDRGTNFDVLSRRWNDADGCWDIKLRESASDVANPDAVTGSPHLDTDLQASADDPGSLADSEPDSIEDALASDDSPGHRTDDGGWTNEADGIRLTPEQNAAADALLEKAARSEPQITSDMQTIARLSGAHPEGLDFRLKGEDSLKRKIFSDLSETPHPGAPAVNVKDAVRYTFIHDESSYTDGVEAARQMMHERGYESVGLKNTWGAPGYQGINSTWKSPDGQLFELQHHTPTSFETKMSTHEMYEEERLPGTSTERKIELAIAQRDLFSRVPVPDEAQGIHAHTPDQAQAPKPADPMQRIEERLGGSGPGTPERSGAEAPADHPDDATVARDAGPIESGHEGPQGDASTPEERYVHPGADAEAHYRAAVEAHGHHNPEGWIDAANPHYASGEPRWTQNCGSNARSFADTFQGVEVRPPMGDGRIPPGEVSEMWEALDVETPPRISNDAREVSTPDFTSDAYRRVHDALRNEPPGTVAIIGVDWDVPDKPLGAGGGHWFNAFVDDAGRVRFADQQIGQLADWPPPYNDIWNLDLAVRNDGAGPWRGTVL